MNLNQNGNSYGWWTLFWLLHIQASSYNIFLKIRNYFFLGLQEHIYKLHVMCTCMYIQCRWMQCLIMTFPMAITSSCMPANWLDSWEVWVKIQAGKRNVWLSCTAYTRSHSENEQFSTHLSHSCWIKWPLYITKWETSVVWPNSGTRYIFHYLIRWFAHTYMTSTSIASLINIVVYYLIWSSNSENDYMDTYVITLI